MPLNAGGSNIRWLPTRPLYPCKQRIAVPSPSVPSPLQQQLDSAAFRALSSSGARVP